jgi:acetylornithine aminotransferase
MSAVQICLNHSTSQSPYKLSQFFNLERENNLVRGTSVIRTNFRRAAVSACLNVDVDAANARKITSEKTKEVIENEGKFLVGTYARVPVVLERGEGCKVYDIEGREYLDLSAGIAVNALGHGDADWLKAVVDQAGTLTHTSNIFYSIPQVGINHFSICIRAITRACLDQLI